MPILVLICQYNAIGYYQGFNCWRIGLYAWVHFNDYLLKYIWI